MTVRRDAGAQVDIPVVAWSELWPDFVSAWDQGQHLVTLGRTGRGKTTFELHVAELRRRYRAGNVAVFCTKKRDDTVHDLHWPTVRAWPPSWAASANVPCWM